MTFLSQKFGAEKGGAVVTITGTNFSSTGGITVADVFFGSTDVPASNAFPVRGLGRVLHRRGTELDHRVCPGREQRGRG